MRLWRLLAVFVIAAGGYGASAESLITKPCELPDVGRPARCGVLEVPEDPAKPAGRKLAIHVAIIPASSGKSSSDPIALLMGGPGETAIGSAAYYVDWLSPLMKERDLLLVDQRGTGQSAGLLCGRAPPEAAADYLLHVFPPKVIGACRKKLEKQADLRRYTVPYFVRDLEEVRRAAGYGKLNLFAGSYGTRSAQIYLRTYPENVRTAFLGSVIPIDVATPVSFAKTADGAMERLYADCAADEACHATYPDLREATAAIMTQLDSGTVRVPLPGTGEMVPLPRGRVAEWFRNQLYHPASTANLPWLIHQAFTGDWKPIAAGILRRLDTGDDELSTGVFFSITCNEDIALVSEADVAAQSEVGDLRDYRFREQQAICRDWPKGPLPKEHRLPVKSAIPTLFVTGDHDGGTPLWFTEHVAPGFSHSAVLIAPGQGHTEWSDCIAAAYGRLLQTGAAESLGGSCPPTPLPPFKR